MFGTFRLALAAMVVMSHLGFNPGGLTLGAVAVVMFFLISGFAMTGLLQIRFPDVRSAPLFYLERIVRLAPQYYTWLSILALFYFGLRLHELNLDGFWPYGLFSYITILPLGFQGFFGPVKTLLLPIASTLAIEMSFYLLSPFVLTSRWLSLAAGTGSLAIFVATKLGWLTAGLFTYYTSPGPAFAYILGSLLFRRDWIAFAGLMVLAIAVLATSLSIPFHAEFLVGVLAGSVVIAAIRPFKAGALDTALGDASYGCYLGHSAVILVGLSIFPQPTTFSPAFRLGAVLMSCFAGYVAYSLVERPTVRFRRSLGGRSVRVARC